MDITECPLPSSSFDAIVAFNVLERIKDDRRAVQEMGRLLKPGGILVLEVPAGPLLYDGYDAYLRHFRRYTASSFRALLNSARLDILRQSALGFLVYPAFWLTKKINRARYGQTPNADLVARAIRSTKESGVIRFAFACEAWLARLIQCPRGIRCTVVGRRRFESKSIAAADIAPTAS